MSKGPRFELDHKGTKLSFSATLDRDGRRIDIRLKDGGHQRIRVAKEVRALSGVMPSVEGDVLYCLHTDGSESFRDTMTGEVLSFDQVTERGSTFYS